MDSHLNRTGESRLVPAWFESAAGRFVSWANDLPGDELTPSRSITTTFPPRNGPCSARCSSWSRPKTFKAQGQIDATRGTVREAVEKAAQIVASPVTATWVKTKWGSGYLEKENVSTGCC